MSGLNISKGQFFENIRRDFEGMADAKAVLLKCRDPEGTKCGPTYKDGVIIDPTITVVTPPGRWAWDIVGYNDPPELTKAIRTITLSLMYELADTCSVDEVTFENAVGTAHAVREMLTCPEWSEVTDEMIEQILNSPDEEGESQ